MKNLKDITEMSMTGLILELEESGRTERDEVIDFLNEYDITDEYKEELLNELLTHLVFFEPETTETVRELNLQIVFEDDELVTEYGMIEALEEVIRLIKDGNTAGYSHGSISEWSIDIEEEEVDTIEDEWGNPQIVDED